MYSIVNLIKFLEEVHTVEEYSAREIEIIPVEEGWDSGRILYKSLSEDCLKAIDVAVTTLVDKKRLYYALAAARILDSTDDEFVKSVNTLKSAASRILPSQFKHLASIVALELAGGGIVSLGSDTAELLRSNARDYLVNVQALSRICSIANHYKFSVKHLFKLARLYFRNPDEDFEKFGYFFTAYDSTHVYVEYPNGKIEIIVYSELKARLNGVL